MTVSTTPPVILLVSTGGTISMIRDVAHGKSVQALTGADLVARSLFASAFTVRVIDLEWETGRLDYMLTLARYLHEASYSQIDGIVVTHGTDTLEEVAYGIDEMVPAPVPIVFTGAMYPSWAVGYDGIRNLENAFRVAMTASCEYGALVTMNDEVFEAWSVYKSDTGAKDAFVARRGAPHGRIFGDRVSVPWKPVPRVRIGKIPVSFPSSVPILMMGVADDGCLLDELPPVSLQGLVIAGMAAGSVPPAARKRMLQLAEQGLPIVLCSSAASGRTADEYYYPHAYDDLHNAGVVIENWLSPRKARIRLILSLALHEPYVPFGKELLA